MTEASGTVESVEDRGSGSRWLARLRQGLTFRRELIPIKMILFLFFGGMASFQPYLTLHMQQLGITVKEISVIYAFLPIASILGPPITGIIADKIGKYKIVLFLNSMMTIVLHCLMLYVPARPRNPLTLWCGPQGHALTWASCHLCHQPHNNTNLHLTLKQCEFQCETPPPELTICLQDDNDLSCRSFNVTEKVTINGTVASWRDGDTCSHTWYDVQYEDKVFHGLTCPSECPVQCQVEETLQCTNPDDLSNDTNTFWIYFALRTAATFFLVSCFTMMEATILAVVKEYKADYGKQRVLCTLGLAVVPLLAGLAVDKHSANLGHSDYMPAFYLGSGLVLVAMMMVLRLQFTVVMSSKTLLQDLKELVTKAEINIFLVIVLLMGSSWGFIESYLFVFLKELNAPNYLLGLTMTVGCLVGIPVMFLADNVIKMMGRTTIFIFSFFTYAVRLFGYAYMTEPWMVFPFEMLEVFTSQLMWVACVTFCPVLAPKGLLATMTGLVGCTHFSLGRGVGSLLGGYLITTFGLSGAFKTFGYISFTNGVLYVVTHICFLKQRLAAREEEMAKDKEVQEKEEGEPMLEDKCRAATILPAGTANGRHTSVSTSTSSSL